MLPTKALLVIVILSSLALLYPGVTQPVLTLTGTIEKSDLVDVGIELIAEEQGNRQMLTMFSSMMGLDQLEGEVEAYHVTRSIWETAEELAKSQNLLVAFLVLLFSVVIPTCKLIMQLLYLIFPFLQKYITWCINLISKWSMTDVFVMALVVSYLAGRASGQMGELVRMTSSLEVGFYFFLAYSLFSIASTGLFNLHLKQTSKP